VNDFLKNGDMVKLRPNIGFWNETRHCVTYVTEKTPPVIIVDIIKARSTASGEMMEIYKFYCPWNGNIMSHTIEPHETGMKKAFWIIK
jgi:hypothetical protein